MQHEDIYQQLCADQQLQVNESIMHQCAITSPGELYQSNPRFVRLCRQAGLSFEEACELDETRIRQGCSERVVTAIVRNKAHLERLWETYDPVKLELSMTWDEFCGHQRSRVSVPQTVTKGDRAKVLARLLRQYLEMLREDGCAKAAISFRQLGRAVGIDHQEEVSRIVNRWLDEGDWLGLVETGKPNPSLRRAHVYRLLN
jgi:hypothetical protein